MSVSSLVRLLLPTAIVFVNVVVVGCVMDSSKARVTSEYAVSVKNVGVMSLLDPTPNLSYLRASAQESHFAELGVLGWNADALALDALQGRLQRKGFNVVAVTPDTRVREAYGTDWGFPASEPLHTALYDLGQSLNLDMIVVVCRQINADLVTGTNQNIRGYGLQRAFDTGPYAYATVFVEALDVRKRFAVGGATGEQHAAIAPELWQVEFESGRGLLSVKSTNQVAVHDTLEKLLTSAIGIAIQEAGL